ncbi:MAG: STAS domain-containing protein [Fibrobacteria bacterium]|nr:STAS domain-containing protein [Fibrobacteria bacterium]
MENLWEIEVKDYGTMLSLSKEMDMDRINEFSNYINENLHPEKSKVFIINLENVNFIDSMVLGILNNLRLRCEKKGGHVLLYMVKKGIIDMLNTSGLLNFFHVFQTEDELIEFNRHI